MASRPAGWDVDGETVVKGGLKRIHIFTRSHFSSHQRLSSESSSPLLIQILIQGAARRVGESAANHMNQEWERGVRRLDAFDLGAACSECCGDWKEKAWKFGKLVTSKHGLHGIINWSPGWMLLIYGLLVVEKESRCENIKRKEGKQMKRRLKDFSRNLWRRSENLGGVWATGMARWGPPHLRRAVFLFFGYCWFIMYIAHCIAAHL